VVLWLSSAASPVAACPPLLHAHRCSTTTIAVSRPTPVDTTDSTSAEKAAPPAAVKTQHAEVDPVMEFYLKYTKRDASGKMIVHDLPEDLAMLFKEAHVTANELKDPATIAPLIKVRVCYLCCVSLIESPPPPTLMFLRVVCVGAIFVSVSMSVTFF
jgi:hypothetical protein